VRLADRFTQGDRDAILEALRKRGVACSNYFVPIHTQPYIMEAMGTKAGDYPVTEHVAARTIALPFFANLSADQVRRVRQALLDAIPGLR
jgi:perosamine synthetase